MSAALFDLAIDDVPISGKFITRTIFNVQDTGLVVKSELVAVVVPNRFLLSGVCFLLFDIVSSSRIYPQEQKSDPPA